MFLFFLHPAEKRVAVEEVLKGSLLHNRSFAEDSYGIEIPYRAESVIELETDGQNLQHKGILKAWADEILGRGKCVAEGKEGINCVILSDAMYLSAFTGKTVSLPFDGKVYLKELNKRSMSSKAKEPAKDPLAPINETFAVKDTKLIDSYFGIVDKPTESKG